MSFFRLVGIALCAGVVTVPIALLAGQNPQPSPPTTQGPPNQPANQDDINRVVNETCAACHGARLEGGRADSLADDRWMFGGDDASILRSITDGRPGTEMAAFKDVLSEAQIRQLLIYIREQGARRQTQSRPPVVDPDGRVVHTEEHSFKMEVVAQGLETPWGIAVLPDGRMLVTERPGRLRFVSPGKVVSEPIAGTPVVWTRQDGGLFDVEVHPDYARNGWVYLSYAEPGPDDTSMTTIVRGRIREGKWVEQETLFKAPPSLYTKSNIHYGSRFLFDSTGHLLFSIGDRGRDTSAQDLSAPTGKIHRITDSGGVPADNPLRDRPGALATIWSYGHRNPQGLAFDARGALWATEHGPRGGDELNRVHAGHNYGWPLITMGLHTYPNSSAQLTREGLESPVAHWTPTIAPAGITFYQGDRFPRWKGHLLLTGLAGQSLRRLVTDGDRVTHQEVLFDSYGRVRDIVMGPDGDLYVSLNDPGARLSDTTPGRIVRLVPAESRPAGADSPSAGRR